MTNVSNNCLDNFETNRDQELGKAIAEAAKTISKTIKKEIPTKKEENTKNQTAEK